MLICSRLAIAASALTGVVLAARQYDVWWTALSQLASLGVGASYALMVLFPVLTGRTVPGSDWLRGALATVMLLVSLAFLAMQHGNVLDPYSVFEHLLTPALVVADVLVVRRVHEHVSSPWWHPLTWAAVPLPYLAWYVAGDLHVYAALDRSRPVDLVVCTGLLLALLLVAAYAVRAVGGSAAGAADRLLGRLRERWTGPLVVD
jgi:hypothetical protein